MFNIEEWCGLTREQLARQHRDRLIEKAKQRRDQYRPRQIVTVPPLVPANYELGDQPGTYVVTVRDHTMPAGYGRAQRVTLRRLSIQR